MATDEALRARVQPVVDEMAAYLGLSQTWHLTYKIGKVEKGGSPNSITSAVIDWVSHYRRAEITMDRGWLQKAPESEVQRSVTHELLHLMAAPMDDTMESLFGAGEVFERYRLERESLLDQMTRVILRALAKEGDGAGFSP